MWGLAGITRGEPDLAEAALLAAAERAVGHGVLGPAKGLARGKRDIAIAADVLALEGLARHGHGRHGTAQLSSAQLSEAKLEFKQTIKLKLKLQRNTTLKLS